MVGELETGDVGNEVEVRGKEQAVEVDRLLSPCHTCDSAPWLLLVVSLLVAHFISTCRNLLKRKLESDGFGNS